VIESDIAISGAARPVNVNEYVEEKASGHGHFLESRLEEICDDLILCISKGEGEGRGSRVWCPHDGEVGDFWIQSGPYDAEEE
jgi:hypothetical protein